jgi:hypothetical protein
MTSLSASTVEFGPRTRKDKLQLGSSEVGSHDLLSRSDTLSLHTKPTLQRKATRRGTLHREKHEEDITKNKKATISSWGRFHAVLSSLFWVGGLLVVESAAGGPGSDPARFARRKGKRKREREKERETGKEREGKNVGGPRSGPGAKEGEESRMRSKKRTKNQQEGKQD